MENQSRDILQAGELHPMAVTALKYIYELGVEKLYTYLGSFSSVAIEGNRLAEVCAGTLRRIIGNQKVSDRYVMGLGWAIRQIEDSKKECEEDSKMIENKKQGKDKKLRCDICHDIITSKIRFEMDKKAKGKKQAKIGPYELGKAYNVCFSCMIQEIKHKITKI